MPIMTPEDYRNLYPEEYPVNEYGQEVSASGVAWVNVGDYTAAVQAAGITSEDDPDLAAIVEEFANMPPAVVDTTPVENYYGELIPEVMPPIVTMGISPGVVLAIAAMIGESIDWVQENWESVSYLASVALDFLAGPLDETILGGTGLSPETILFEPGPEYPGSGGQPMTMSNYPMIPGTDIVLQGPGNPEPYPAYIAKEWAGIGGSRFYLLITGDTVVRRKNGTWRKIRRPAMLHMKISNPRMGDVVKADKVVNRVAKVMKKRLHLGAKKR